MKTFAILSALKAGLDVIEGSSVGASFGATAELEVGDVAQPAYDYVDVSWNTLLAGSVTLVGLGFLLDAAAGLEDLLLNLLLVIAVFAAGVSIFRPQARHLRGWLRDLLSVSMVVWLALAFVLPFSVLGASHLSARITAASIQEAEDGFS